MCYAFVSYFPKAEGFDQCVQYFTYDQCDNYNRQCESSFLVPHIWFDVYQDNKKIVAIIISNHAKWGRCCDSAAVENNE